MVVLCGGRLQEKYKYLFTQVADHNNCCTRRKLAQLLKDLAKIPEALSEKPSFGVRLVSAAVNSCFTENANEIGITEETLLSWLLQEPQTLVWWTTLYRLSSAELVCHDIKCGVCKQRPVIGLRYQCLRCLGYNICQDCFLHARTSKNHKLTHPILEYCHETTNKEWRKAFIKTLRHKLTRNSQNKQRYLSISSNNNGNLHLTSLLNENEPNPTEWSCEQDDEAECEEQELMSRTILHPDDDEQSLNCNERCAVGSSNEDLVDNKIQKVKLRKENLHHPKSSEPKIIPSTPRHQIHSVIMNLQQGHQQLWDGLENNSNKKPLSEDLVEQHTLQLQTQINKLKDILQSYNKVKVDDNKGFKRSLCLESTPIVAERGLYLNLSPISALPNTFDDSAVIDNKENHLVENPILSNNNQNRFSNAENSHRPLRSPYTPRQRMALIPVSTPPIDQDASSKNTSYNSKLPSFTDINFSDLTPSSSSPVLSTSSEPVELSVKSKKGNYSVKDPSILNNTEIGEVKEEIEMILKQLDEIFPMAEAEGIIDSAETGGVIQAACELGDVLANYVSIVPQSKDKSP